VVANDSGAVPVASAVPLRPLALRETLDVKASDGDTASDAVVSDLLRETARWDKSCSRVLKLVSS